MRNKKLLASLLSAALVVSCLPMNVNAAAGTINNGANSKLGSFEVSDEVLATDLEFIRMDETLQPVSAEEEAALQNAIKNPGVTVEAVEEGSVEIDTTQIAEVEAVEDLHADDEVVKAIIITEDESLLEQGYEIEEIGSTSSAIKAEDALEESQNEVIEAIEKEVLDGDSLDVEYTYQYATSAIAVTVTYAELKEIEKVSGVKTAFVSPQFELDPNEYTVNTIASESMISKDVAQNKLGYTGQGTVIAILDTGIDVNHPSFVALPETSLTEDSLTVEDIAEVLPSLNAYSLMDGKITAKDLYGTTKLAYEFNYADVSADVTHHGRSEHGTHVAGIAAADKIESSDVIGVAPDAQLVICKVFGSKKDTADFVDILAAIEDCIVLHVDTINMSLGSSAGFSSDGEEVDEIFARVADAGIVMSVSAGNSTSAAYKNASGYDLNGVDHPDNGIVDSPSTLSSSTSVASIDNIGMTSEDYISVGDDFIILTPGTFPEGYKDTFLSALAGKKLEYAMVDNCGQELSDFTAADVKGKVAVVSRGVTTFASKMALAKQAGAVGVIIYNNTTGSISMDLSTAKVAECIPAASIKMSEGEILKNAATKELTVGDGSSTATVYGDEQYYTMSSFSSWGVTPDLNLVPDITAPGGSIYSTLDQSKYGLMSGTSMAAPQVAGCFALMKERLHAEYPELKGFELYTVTNALLMSTAEPVVKYNDDLNDVEYSPRKQGSGLVNLEKALTAETYLSVPDTDKPSVSLYDDPERTGKYSFTFDIVNMNDKAVTYDLDASVLTEAIFEDEDGNLYMAEHPLCLDDAAVAFSAESVTVEANGKASVSVSITLTEDDKEYMDTYFKNGIYVEGFVYLTSDDDADLSLPYMGFYGDWTKGAMLDSGYYNDPESVATAQWNNTLFIDFGESYNLLGFNPYLSDSKVYHNVISPNGDKYADTFDDIYYGLLRNAKDITITFTDKNSKEEYNKMVLPYVRKEFYQATAGQMIPAYISGLTDEMYDFTDAEGNALTDGTVVEMKSVATLDYDRHEQNNDSDTWVEDILIDTVAPELISASYASGELTLRVKDEGYMAGVLFADASGDILDRAEVTGELGETITKTFDVDGFGQEFYVVLGDYGCNEETYKVVCSSNEKFVETLGLAGLNADSSTVDLFDFETDEIITVMDYTGFEMVAADTVEDGTIFFVCVMNDKDYILYLPKEEDDYGELKALGSLPLSSFDIRDIGYDSTTATLYMAGGETASIFALDLKEGSVIDAFNLNGVMESVDAITVDSKGNVYFADNHALVAKITTSGSLSGIVNFGLDLEGKYTSTLAYDSFNEEFYYGFNDTEIGEYYVIAVSGDWKKIVDEFALPDTYHALFMIPGKEYEAQTDIVTELGTWVSGSYAQHNAKEENNAKRIRLTESLAVTANDTYEAVVSNPAFRFIVRKVDGNGKVSTFYLSNGDRFKAEENATYYVCVHNVYNNYKELDFAMYQDFFRGGMIMNIKNVSEAANIEKTEVENELGIWKSGTYSQDKAVVTENKQRIYLEGAFETVAGHEYEAVVSDDSFRFIVRKVDNETNTVSTIYLANGEKFVAEEGYTYYLSSQNYLGKHKDVTYQTYVGLFENGFVFTMKDLDAPEEVVEETTEEVSEEVVEETTEETVEVVETTEESVSETVEESEEEAPVNAETTEETVTEAADAE